MKIFNKENGKEKVYVQLEDIMMLLSEDINCCVPASIFDKIFKNILIVSEDNRWNFVQFELPEQVEFFRSLDWIVDYKECRNMIREDAIACAAGVAEEFNQNVEIWNNMSVEERDNNQDLFIKCNLLQYKYDSLPRVFFVGQGHIKLDLPDVIDSDGYDCGSNEEYIAKSALDPNKVIICRKDGNPINKHNIKKSYIKDVIANSLINLEEVRAGLCTANKAKYTISEDGLSIIIEISVSPILSQEELEMKRENSFTKRFFKSFTKSTK